MFCHVDENIKDERQNAGESSLLFLCQSSSRRGSSTVEKNRRTSSQVLTYSIEFEFFWHLLCALSRQKLCLYLSVIGSDLNPSLGTSSVLLEDYLHSCHTSTAYPSLHVLPVPVCALRLPLTVQRHAC